MITQLIGKIIEKQPTYLVLDCNGIGYFVNISLQTYDKILQKEQENFLKIYTHLQIKEDGHHLFGFYEKQERTIFRLLILVSGIGTNIARIMLSSLNTQEIAEAILSENVKKIQSIKGIGVKTAQRVILDLKDKISKIIDSDKMNPIKLEKSEKEDAMIALENLGFLRKKTEKIVEKIIAENPEITLEQIIKQTLKNIS